jgi:RNA polymerase sigma factor (sigma-70 family)
MAIPLKPIARRALAAQSDDRLVRLLRDGHEPAFDEIVRRYREPLVAFAAAIADASRAEDVVQAGLMRAHGALLADEREISLRPWLFAIVRNGALNAIRDEPTWSELDSDQQGGEQAPAAVEQREELEHLVNAICALPEAQRQALVMREMEGVGHADIAAKLHTSPTAVRGLIFRARTTLRNALGALVPLPILRWLLDDAAAAAAVTVAGTGTGSALLGGALSKAAVGLTAAVVAVGAGKAIEDRRSGDERVGTDDAAAQAATGSGPGRAGGNGPAGSGSGGPGSEEGVETRAERREELRDRAADRREEQRERERDGAEDARHAREDRRDENAADDGDDNRGGDDDSSSGDSGGSSGSSSDHGGSSGSSGSSGSGHGGSSGSSGSSDSGHGGSSDSSGSGSDDDFETDERDDESGSGADSSGSGSGSDHEDGSLTTDRLGALSSSVA